MNKLIIGSVTAIWTPDEPKSTPDDRQELVKTVSYSGGAFVPSVVVVDGGYATAGQVDQYSGVKIAVDDWPFLYGYWADRTLVTVTGADGIQVPNCRVVLRSWSPNKRMEVMTVDLEIWRA